MSESERTPGVAEQVPRPAHHVASLEDGEGAARALGLQAVRRTDAGEPCPDDHDVEVLGFFPAHLAFHTGSRFSAKAVGPSMASSVDISATISSSLACQASRS